ncbi:MAG: hypothetical protein HY903_21950 [Deltaproteobacteria bacterium]|nr:hypothetical protein [Deltaproteobacteria bacterium]
MDSTDTMSLAQALRRGLRGPRRRADRVAALERDAADLAKRFHARFGAVEPELAPLPASALGLKRKLPCIRAGDDTYLLCVETSLDERVLADAHLGGPDGRTATISISGTYRGLPRRRKARREHLLLAILEAIARHELGNADAVKIVRRRTELWCELHGREAGQRARSAN